MRATTAAGQQHSTPRMPRIIAHSAFFEFGAGAP
jgi:hypothetical protein